MIPADSKHHIGVIISLILQKKMNNDFQKINKTKLMDLRNFPSNFQCLIKALNDALPVYLSP